MPEIGTSGSMSGDGKRSDAEWPKLPRPSSTLPSPTSRGDPGMSACGAKSGPAAEIVGGPTLTHTAGPLGPDSEQSTSGIRTCAYRCGRLRIAEVLQQGICIEINTRI